MMGSGGEISVDAIKRILVIQEKLERYNSHKYNRDVAGAKKDKPEIGSYLRDVTVPPPSPLMLQQIPRSDIELLRKEHEPEDVEEFDKEYGAGMAEYFLGRTK
jgi:hypothetical protein